MNKAQIPSPATSDLWTHTFKLSWMLSFNIYKICASKMEFPDKITYYAFIFSQLFYVSTFQVLFRKSVWNLIFNKVFVLRFKQKKTNKPLCTSGGPCPRRSPFFGPVEAESFLFLGYCISGLGGPQAPGHFSVFTSHLPTGDLWCVHGIWLFKQLLGWNANHWACVASAFTCRVCATAPEMLR